MYGNDGVMLSIINEKDQTSRFEFKNMFSAVKFMKKFSDTTHSRIMDIEIHEICIPSENDE